jgi:ParB/RepB/Spo0J family partition protein
MLKRSSASALRPSPDKVQEINIDDIKVRARLRSLNQAKVDEYVESIARQGFLDPIEVRIANKWGNTDEKEIVLVAGWHRLEAMKKRGAKTIPAFVLPDDRVKAEMRETSENLHRAGLTPLEEAEHIANWVGLASEQDEVKGHNVPKSGPGRPKGVIAKAAASLPIKANAPSRYQSDIVHALSQGAIEDTKFGTITIDGKTYEHDVVIRLSGEVVKRKKKLSKKYYGTSHMLSKDEAKFVHSSWLY